MTGGLVVDIDRLEKIIPFNKNKLSAYVCQ